MSEKNGNWKDLGLNGASVFPGAPYTHLVEDTRTGERREVLVNPGEDVGTAIANGDFKDKE